MDDARRDAGSNSTAVAEPPQNASTPPKGKSGAAGDTQPEDGVKADPAKESDAELARDLGKDASGKGSGAAAKGDDGSQKQLQGRAGGEKPGDQNGKGGEASGQGEASGLDAKTEALLKKEIEARLKSLLDERIEAVREPLLAVNRELALYFDEQLEMIIALRQSVTAMERLIESEAKRKAKYSTLLEKVKSEGAGMPDPHWINRTRGMLAMLERTGTVGPKRDDGPGQS